MGIQYIEFGRAQDQQKILKSVRSWIQQERLRVSRLITYNNYLRSIIDLIWVDVLWFTKEDIVLQSIRLGGAMSMFLSKIETIIVNSLYTLLEGDSGDSIQHIYIYKHINDSDRIKSQENCTMEASNIFEDLLNKNNCLCIPPKSHSKTFYNRFKYYQNLLHAYFPCYKKGQRFIHYISLSI